MSCHEYEACTQAASPYRARSAKANFRGRRCGCGEAAGLTDECAECRSKRLAPQRRAGLDGAAEHASAEASVRPASGPTFGHDFGSVSVRGGGQVFAAAQLGDAVEWADEVMKQSAAKASAASEAAPPAASASRSASPAAPPAPARRVTETAERRPRKVTDMIERSPHRRGQKPPPAPGCSFNVQYANEHTVNFCKPKTCGGAIQFDIVGVTAKGPACPPKLDGLDVTEHVTSDSGCAKMPNKPVTGQFTLGPGGTPPSNATDTYGFCFPQDLMFGPSCIQKMTQQVYVGGMLADTRTITFYIERHYDFSAPGGMRCGASITRS